MIRAIQRHLDRSGEVTSERSLHSGCAYGRDDTNRKKPEDVRSTTMSFSDCTTEDIRERSPDRLRRGDDRKKGGLRLVAQVSSGKNSHK